MTADEIKDALRRRHPTDANTGGMVGEWTCIDEWRGVDLLALSAWGKAHVVGYEVKVSRSDLRRELLRPHKRAAAVARSTEFYFAVPEGLLTADELAFDEPEWGDGDFERARCSGVPAFGPPHSYARPSRWGGRCEQWGRGRQPFQVRVPLPAVLRPTPRTPPIWNISREKADDYELGLALREQAEGFIDCPTCSGRGYTAASRVEREAPTLWVPRDVGLVAVGARGCRVVKPSPRRRKPEPLAATRRQLNDLVRWVSHRPDPRHVQTRLGAEHSRLEAAS